MADVSYEIFKQPGDPCGTQTHFTLGIQPNPGLSFVNFNITSAEGPYVTEVKVTLAMGGAGAPLTVDLCDAPVVCFPDSQPLDIVTEVTGDPSRTGTSKTDYNKAEVGGGQMQSS